MRIPNPIPCAFDPETCSSVPGDPLERTLWAGIKRQHLTDNHFRDSVAVAARFIREAEPTDYESFIAVIENSPLNLYGRSRTKSGCTYLGGPDREFWGDMWRFVSGEEELQLVQVERKTSEETS